MRRLRHRVPMVFTLSMLDVFCCRAGLRHAPVASQPGARAMDEPATPWGRTEVTTLEMRATALSKLTDEYVNAAGQARPVGGGRCGDLEQVAVNAADDKGGMV